MDPDMQQHYKELLHLWKNDEDNIKDELKQIVTNMKEFGTGIKEVSTDVKEIGIDLKILTKKLDCLVASTVISASETNDESEYIKTFNDLVVAPRKCKLQKATKFARLAQHVSFRGKSPAGFVGILANRAGLVIM